MISATNLAANSASCLPPATIEETAWDILLALHAEPGREIALARLAGLVSVPRPALEPWLALLENRRLLTGARRGPGAEIRALLTQAGSMLLDRYLAAAGALRAATHH